MLAEIRQLSKANSANPIQGKKGRWRQEGQAGRGRGRGRRKGRDRESLREKERDREKTRGQKGGEREREGNHRNETLRRIIQEELTN